MMYLIMGSYRVCPEAEDFITEIPLLCCDTIDKAQENLDILYRKLVDIGRRRDDGSEEIEYSLPETLWIYPVTDSIVDVDMDVDAINFG